MQYTVDFFFQSCNKNVKKIISDSFSDRKKIVYKKKLSVNINFNCTHSIKHVPVTL